MSTTPWRRDIVDLRSRLAAWARAVRGSDATVSDVRTPIGGMANDTVLFRLGDDDMVVRLAPMPDSPCPVFPSFDLELQERTMRLVAERTTVPVPAVVHHERSEEWLGVPFLVLRAVEGDVPPDDPVYTVEGWVVDATDEQRASLETSSIDVLARLHEIADDGVATSFLHVGAPGHTALAQQLSRQRRYYEWAREGEAIPVVDRAFEVLAKTMPSTCRSVLNWGDARMGNIIFRGFEPVAVLDWEMASVGPPEVDLGWMTFTHALMQWIAEFRGSPGLPDMFGRQRAVATYERLSGEELEDLTWFEAFAGLRFAVISIRQSLRAVAHGLQLPPKRPDHRVMGRPVLETLLAELDR